MSNTMRRLVGLSAVLAAVSLLGACGSEAGTGGTPASSTTAVPSKQPSIGTISPTDLASVPTISGGTGAIADLADKKCDPARGERRATGSLTSSAESASDYLITVSWTTPTGDVLARGFDRVRGLAPGRTRAVSIKADVPSGATQCVWGVERADAN